ncbi:hypothetical protein EVAR_85776_1 [Eumeta japonica]|uniref:Uncharacterized protein n=1 Tax=Eumeta variegata TaxID=151549 RepID=A0A4C2A3Y9_EUMVA|nr:hypothetical protein EVAR_85776_1 [Eumeta japonica]
MSAGSGDGSVLEVAEGAPLVVQCSCVLISHSSGFSMVQHCRMLCALPLCNMKIRLQVTVKWCHAWSGAAAPSRGSLHVHKAPMRPTLVRVLPRSVLAPALVPTADRRTPLARCRRV